MWRIFPTLTVDADAKIAMTAVMTKNPTVIATTSIINGFASPIPSIALEPDEKSESLMAGSCHRGVH
ncbi:MAG: hypothetical protein WB290_01910 [Smithella sp.]